VGRLEVDVERGEALLPDLVGQLPDVTMHEVTNSPIHRISATARGGEVDQTGIEPVTS
jgi:hypothetical protein